LRLTIRAARGSHRSNCDRSSGLECLRAAEGPAWYLFHADPPIGRLGARVLLQAIMALCDLSKMVGAVAIPAPAFSSEAVGSTHKTCYAATITGNGSARRRWLRDHSAPACVRRSAVQSKQKTSSEIIADVESNATEIANTERHLSTMLEDSVRAVMDSRELIARVEAMLARR